MDCQERIVAGASGTSYLGNEMAVYGENNGMGSPSGEGNTVPITVFVHAAGVLADGMILPNIGVVGERMTKVFQAKAHASWQVHRMMCAIGQ
eukprot:NODE_16491_length_991_cov_8.533565.p4 GENE.NODE_16491_length_991_cov_8.533565~~NODE_16491_length_991_cov_8.533565.p4  ORF type:complete len:92 (+),score=33.34 NODE_16491_length_991_cov_8.533565:296-571(+)